ncbi:hypothetical protein E8E14_012302 [Neopestalotiopsis sp. 37M]|nr:hypothetical protein E8E14_012302 [Neopestalotiopsis sp. 37M]
MGRSMEYPLVYEHSLHTSRQFETVRMSEAFLMFTIDGPPGEIEIQDMCQFRTSGFTIDMTSAAIRDAIEVTRALEIRYLWIDALCIVQDDKEDWERESGEMASIYQHAYLTICAAASESVREGFLERYNQSIHVNFQSIINPHVRGAYNLCWHGAIEQPHFADYDYNDFDIDESYWNTRGWTFQEMKMSQRLLLFGRRKLHFWSSTLSWMENETTRSTSYDRISCNSMVIHDLDQSRLSGWLDLIQFYTERALSNHSDKLPAISGLAALASGGHSEHYLAGIREGEMYRDLMWASGETYYWKRDKMPKAQLLHLLQSPDPYIAPSWSWASHFGEIETITGTGRHMFGNRTLSNFAKGYDKLEAWTQKSGLNPYGQISDGALEYSGSVMALSKPLGPAGGKRWNLREYRDTNYSILIWLDWHPDGDEEPVDDLSCILLGTCHPLGEENIQWKYYSMPESDSGSETDDQYPRVTTNPDYGSDGQGLPLSDEEGNDGDEEWYDDSSSAGGQKTLGSPEAKPATLHDSQDHDSITESSTEEEEEEDGEEEKHEDEEEEAEERVAFGLVIHPASKPGKFFRVGIWTSVRREQNYSAVLNAFRSRPSTSIELI